jgi:hypothetical protein
MQWLWLALVAITLTSSSASAQSDEAGPRPKVLAEPAIGLPTSGPVTPEMWFYMQEYQRYQQPKEAVRRKAEIRATQRQNRLEAQRWFGFSNLRPVANPIPFYSSYSPAWIGNPWSPYSWFGNGQPYVTYHTASRSR